MKRLFTIMLFVAMLLPLATRGQAIMPDYTFRTGVDASKWIPLDASATQVHGSGIDTEVSSVLNIGFNFQFGEMYYSQFSVTTDGFLRLGPEAYSSAWQDANFNSAYFPKIAAVVKDLATGSDGYVKYQLVNQEPERVLVVEFKITHQYSTSMAAEVLVQVQLHEDSNKVVLAYASTAPTTSPSSYQIGLGVSENDFLLIDPATHTTTHHTALTNAGTSAWPGASRYYEFVAPVISCPTPALNLVSDLTDNSATISWQENGTATAWIVEYDTAGFTPGTAINREVVYDTFYNLVNLQSNATYDVYVRSFCSTTDTSRINGTQFHTPCVAYDESVLPFTESFETWSSDYIDPCFMKGNTSTDSYYASYPTVNSTYANTGSKSISFYNSSFYNYLILPVFETPINELQISFYLRSSSSYYNVPIMLGVVSADGNISTFDTLGVFENTPSSWQQITLPLGHYQGDNGRFVFLCPDSWSYSNIYLDDITVEALPAAPAPMEVSAIATGSESAIVRWINTGATEFQVSYGTPGFTPDTGAIETVFGADSLELYSLSPNTNYEVYVRAYCNGDSSIWVGPAQFHTACVALTDNDLPYFESFTSWTSSNRDYCYTLGSTDSYYVPSFSSYYSKDSINSVYISSNNTSASWISLPAFDSYISDLQVSFSLYKTSSTDYPFIVGVMTNPNDLSTFDTISVVRCINSGVWEDFIIPLSLYQGEGSYITFLSPNNVASTYYIDAILVDYIPSCPAPINVSARAIDHESAVVYYTPTSTSGTVVAEYGPMDFQLGTGMQETGYDGDSIVITGLTHTTSYDVYVYTDCGSETSSVVGPLHFRTACSNDPIDVTENAYREDFNSYNSDISTSAGSPSSYPNHTLPSCWNIVNMSQSSNNYPQAFLSSSTSYAVSGNCLFFSSSSTTPLYAVLPQFTSNLEDLRLSFTYRNEGTSNYNGTLAIGVMTDPANDSTFCELEVFTRNTSLTEVEYLFSSDTITGSDYYIAFRYTGGDYDNYYLSIDNVVVDLAPVCTRPLSITSTNTTFDAATIQWIDEDNTHSSWEIAYGPNGFMPDSITETGIGAILPVTGVSGDSVTIQNLTSGEIYDFYIRTVCGWEYSEWRGPISAVPGLYTIPSTGMDSVRGCNLIICDDGGFNNPYSSSASGYMVVYPGSQDSLIAIVGGTIDLENSYDYVKIYDGVGTVGTPILQITGTNTITDTIVSTSGSFTIQLTSDYYQSNDDGIMLKLACVGRPDCPEVVDLAASNVSARSALLSWNYLTNAQNTPTSYQVEIIDEFGNIDYVTSTETSSLLTGLTPATQYVVKVKAQCSDSEGAFDSISFTTKCATTYDITISDTTTSENYTIPVDNYYNNSYTQQLVLANEMNGAGTISGIQFEYANTTAMTAKTNVSIYLGHTTSSSLSSWESTANAQLVYSGSLNCTQQGWNTFEFNTSFNYNGTDNLLITIVDFSGNYNGMTYKFKTHNSTGKTLRYSNDYNFSIPPSSSYTADYRNNMKFVICDTVVPTCTAPNVIVSNITSTQIDIMWTAGDAETSWNVDYRLDGDSVWTVAATNVTNTAYSFTNLMPNTAYEFRVVSLCGTETAEAIVSVTTLCAEISDYPFVENFDTWTNLPDCWAAMTTMYYGGVSLDSYISLSSPYSILLESDYSGYSYLAMPKFSLPVDTLILEMAVYKPDNYYAHQLVVGIMTDPSNVATFTQVAQITPANVGWNQVEIAFDSYTGANGHIAIMAPEGDYYELNIDNLNVFPLPTCPRPKNVNIFNVSSSQADVSYTSNAGMFEIAYGAPGFSLDTVGTYQVMTATDTFATITNLTPNTRYDVYVRAICAANDTSYWSYRASFKTACVSVAVPYTENFDSYTTDIASYSSAPSSYPEHTMPDCWNFVNMSTSSSDYPQAFLSSYGDYAVSGNCLFFKSSGTTPIYSVLPKFDVSIDSLYIEFAYRNEGTGSSNGTLSLGVMTDPSNPATFISLETYQQITTITSIEHYFSFDTLQGNNYYIAFCYTGGSYDNYYLSIDDVFVDYAPSCFKPRNLTAGNAGQRSVDLNWSDPNNAGDYVVEYKTGAETAWNAVYGITDTFTTITNLSPSSGYSFRVKAVCSANDSSYYSNIATARTLCGPVELPFGEDFSASGFLYDCWSKLNGIAFDTTTSPSTTTYGGFEHTTSNNGLQGSHVKANIWGTSTKYWLVTPEIDLTNVGASQLTFDLALTDYSNGDTIEADKYTYDDKFMVIVSTDTGNTWLQQNATIWSDDTTINANYSYRGIYTSGQQITIDLSQYSGNIIKIAFYAESTVGSSNGTNGGDNDLHIDNILISSGSNCPTPTMTVTNDATTATLSWTSTATDFEIEYKEASANEWSQTIAVSNVTSYTITGLTPETDYMVRLRAVCEEGEYSAWKTSTITTPELPCLPPTNVTATNITYSSATISWTDPTNNQTEWTVEYGYGDNIQTVTATTTSVELTGLYSGMTYTVRVQGRCSAEVTSEWSDAYTFTTATCESVSNLTADNITSSSAVISWTAPAGQTKWELTYGMQGVDEDHGTKVTVTDNPTYTIEGLDYETSYDVYVRAVCGEGVYSAWSQKLSFTTRPVGINTAAADNTNVNIYPNPANTQATITVEGVNGKVEFAVADMNGRMIVTETIDCNGELVKTIDVSNLAKGAYFVHIYNDNFNATRKLIVK